MHINSQGIINKVNEIELITSECKPNILCVTESWLHTDAVQFFSFSDYRLLSHFCRSDHIRGGTAIFVQEKIEVKPLQIIKDYAIEMHIECCGILVSLDEFKTIIINIYRPPSGDLDTFLISLAHILQHASNICTNIILCGDLNIDSLESNIKSKLLSDLLESYDIKNYCVDATRIFTNKLGRTSATSIDYMATNLHDSPIKFTNFNTGISDHLAQILEIEINSKHTTITDLPKTITIRHMKDHNIASLKHSLEKETWEGINAPDIDVAFESFLNIFLWHLNVECPKREYKVKCNDNVKKDWVTYEIKKSSEELKDLYKLLRQHHTKELQQLYQEKMKTHKNTVNNAKKNHNKNRIIDSANKSRTIWEIVNEELGRNKKQDNIKLATNDHLEDDASEIANEFGKYFSTVSETKLQEHFGKNISNKCTTSANQNQTMFFAPVDEVEIKDILTTLANKKSCGPDEVSLKVLKSVRDVISEPLAILVNKSIECGKFPSILKLAIIVPIYKKGDSKQIENYRPISILSVFSKVFEKTMYIRITKYCNKFQLMSNTQHGFREGRSTESASFHLVEHIHKQLDNNLYVVGLFFDLSRAFDTIDPLFVKSKLESLGIRGQPLNWVISFLSNRSIQVKINNTLSSVYSINVGAAQGSVLAPLIFLLFINDIKLSGFMINFADDTSVIISADSLEKLKENINNASQQMYQWCATNRLILNKDKTETVQFYKTIPYLPPTDFSGSVKFLGSYIDCTLSWNHQIDHIAKKLNSAYYALKKLKPSVPESTLVQSYYALAHTHLCYNIIIWGRAPDVTSRIFIIQKRLVRLIFNLKYMESCKPIFQDKRILTVPCIYILKCATFVHKNMDLYLKNNNYHDYSTRNSTELCIPKHNTAKYERSPLYSSLIIYNSVPKEIKAIKNTGKFYSRLKRFLVEHSLYSLNEFL